MFVTTDKAWNMYDTTMPLYEYQEMIETQQKELTKKANKLD